MTSTVLQNTVVGETGARKRCSLQFPSERPRFHPWNGISNLTNRSRLGHRTGAKESLDKKGITLTVNCRARRRSLHQLSRRRRGRSTASAAHARSQLAYAARASGRAGVALTAMLMQEEEARRRSRKSLWSMAESGAELASPAVPSSHDFIGQK
jgi:hypothetical protein